MEVLHITQAQYLADGSEIRYGFHTISNSLVVPHDHDFYELLLVTSGSMEYELCGRCFTLSEGDFLLVRPGDVHCKRYTERPCQNINLAFPARTIDALFDFIYDEDCKQCLLALPVIPVIHLPPNDKKVIQQELEKLNLLPLSQPMLSRTQLRFLLVDIFRAHLSPLVLGSCSVGERHQLPAWLSRLLQRMQSPETFSMNLQDWSAEAGKSPEYLCRIFQKHLHTTPSTYLSTLHLNYAANLLAHTDISIIDVAYECGFQSLSHFYHCFRREFHTSPKKYRQVNTWQF